MDKKSVYWIGGVVVVALVLWGIYAYNHQGAQQTNNQQASTQGNSNGGSTGTSTPTSIPASNNPSGKKLSYGDAIKTYTERFQFSQCQGTPATIAIRLGSPVMLDNRDATSHTFKADTQTFKIAGYDYALLYPKVVGNLVVTCDGKDRVTLNVEK